MTWFDWMFFILFLIVSGISCFCFIFTLVTFWRKKDDEPLFPKKY